MKKQFSNLPVVAICGRPNVGKSTLFNRLAGRRQAIVADEAGITRDRYETVVGFKDKNFILVDTGGMVDKWDDSVTGKVQEQVKKALESADVVIMVVNGREELTALDFDVRDFHKLINLYYLLQIRLMTKNIF
jgi:GTP-binding protein